jgi:hypothetical protein
LREDILRAIAADVNRHSSRKRGRQGMDYWPILVLAAVRLGCNLNYDKLQDLAEQHRALRQIMGIGDWDEKTRFDWRRIRDNIVQVRPETIERINHLIVAEGHQLLPRAAETTRADSFVMETNIHYPTESSLIRDGLRKVLQSCVALAALTACGGWRQHRHLYRKAKALARQIQRVAARKGSGYHQRLEALYRELLALADTILLRAEKRRERLQSRAAAGVEVLAVDAELKLFLERTRHVCGTARRRVLQGENVPNQDKLFSIFEPHTQLYTRGKTAQPVQFGRQVLLYEDGAGFVTHAYLLPRDANDRDVVIRQTRALQKRLRGRIRRASFDRGFHSPENQRLAGGQWTGALSRPHGAGIQPLHPVGRARSQPSRAGQAPAGPARYALQGSRVATQKNGRLSRARAFARVVLLRFSPAVSLSSSLPPRLLATTRLARPPISPQSIGELLLLTIFALFPHSVSPGQYAEIGLFPTDTLARRWACDEGRGKVW